MITWLIKLPTETITPDSCIIEYVSWKENYICINLSIMMMILKRYVIWNSDTTLAFLASETTDGNIKMTVTSQASSSVCVSSGRSGNAGLCAIISYNTHWWGWRAPPSWWRAGRQAWGAAWGGMPWSLVMPLLLLETKTKERQTLTIQITMIITINTITIHIRIKTKW